MTNNPTPPVPGVIWGYNENSARYVDLDTGRFISRQSVFDLTDAAIETFKLVGEDFIRGAIRQGIPVEVVERVLMREVKDGYINSYLAGRGGRVVMTQRDYGIIGQVVRDKYNFVRNFINEIASGKVSEAELVYRWELYYSNMVQGYWKGDLEANRIAGKTKMMRVINSKVPCTECPNYAGYWADIGTLPLPTERCSCKGNCLCTVIYS